LRNVRILASGDLDEWKIEDLLKAGAAIDSFGIGTSLGSGAGSAERNIEVDRWAPSIKKSGMSMDQATSILR